VDEETAFLRGIAASPEDDLPRLVYADWLEERDDPRHEFLRLAVRAHGEATTPSDLSALLNRLCELRRIVTPEWVRQVHPALAMDDVREVVFRSLFGERNVTIAFVESDHVDPSRYLLGLLQQRYPHVRPASAIPKQEGVRRSELELPLGAELYSVGGGQWCEEGMCHLSGSSYSAPEMAAGMDYR